MHHNSQSNDYQPYSYLRRSISTSVQNTHYRFYHPQLDNQPSIYPNTTITTTYVPSYLRQQHQLSTTISDLAEPVSVFDDLKYSRRRRSNLIPPTPVSVPLHSDRRVAALNGTRFATACALRERLLIDIQQNISEIDHELSLLERRPVLPRAIPFRPSSISQRVPPLQYENRKKSTRPSRVYEVIPRITSQPKRISLQATSKPVNLNISSTFVGQYHYPPEIEENEINENDPENTDLKLTVTEILDLSVHEPLSLDQFRRVQSAAAEYHVLIFVPEFLDAPETKANEPPENFHQNNPIVIDVIPPSPVVVSEDSASDSKLTVQTAPESSANIVSPSKPVGDETEADLVPTKLSTLLKHFAPLTETTTSIQEPHSPPEKTVIEPTSSENDTNGDAALFSSDLITDSLDSEGFTSAYYGPMIFRTDSQLIIDHIDNRDVCKQSESPALEQQHGIENKKDNKTTKYIITTVSMMASSPPTSN